MKEINNILIGVEDTDEVDFSHVNFDDKYMIKYIDINGNTEWIENDNLPLGVL